MLLPSQNRGMKATCICAWLLTNPDAVHAASLFEASAFAELRLVGVMSDDPLDMGSDVVLNLFGPVSGADQRAGRVLDGPNTSVVGRASAFSTQPVQADSAIGLPLFRAQAEASGAALTTGAATIVPFAESFLDIDNLSATRGYLLSFEFDYALGASGAALNPRSYADAFGFVEFGASNGLLFSALVQASLPQDRGTDAVVDTLAFDLLLQPGETVLFDLFAVAGGRAAVVPLPAAGWLYGTMLLLGLVAAKRTRGSL